MKRIIRANKEKREIRETREMQKNRINKKVTKTNNKRVRK